MSSQRRGALVRRAYRGQNAAAFLLVFIVIIFAFAILGDFSRALAGYNKARDLADNAALAAANALDARQFNSGRTTLNQNLANERARGIVSDWLAMRFPEEKFIHLTFQQIQIHGLDTMVEISGNVDSVFGTLFGVSGYPVRAVSRARLLVDIQGGPHAAYPRCSYGGTVALGDLTLIFDCLNPWITARFQREDGAAAASILVLPLLQVDRDQDMMPRRALAFTPILFAPQWQAGRARHRVLADGSYQESDTVQFRNIRLYLQAVMVPPTNYGRWPSVVTTTDGLLQFSSDAKNPSTGAGYLFTGASLRASNPYFPMSPAWQLPYEQGSYSMADMSSTLIENMQCTLSQGSSCGPSLDLSSVRSYAPILGTIAHFPEDGLLRGPQFIYIYPGESSRLGSYVDSATGEPAFGVTATTAWNFSVRVIGERYELVQHTDCAGSWEFNPQASACVRADGYPYHYLSTYRVWESRGYQYIPGYEGGRIIGLAPWQISRVLFDGVLSDAFTIPAYQAQAVLTAG
jgi:hypothetical protein